MAEPQFPADTLDLLADANLVVYVAPAQAEYLAAAKPVDEQQDERGIQRIAP